MTDEQIMIMVKNGRTEALAQLYERYKRPLFSYFNRLTSDFELSKDLTQNVFERILRYRHTFQDKMSLRSWLFQVARNVRADHYRFQKLPMEEDVEVSTLEIPQTSDKKDYSLQMARVEKALQLLPVNYREVILLSWFEKMSYTEIAESLEISEGNVKVRMHRAVSKLRIILKKKQHEQVQ